MKISAESFISVIQHEYILNRIFQKLVCIYVGYKLDPYMYVFLGAC